MASIGANSSSNNNNNNNNNAGNNNNTGSKETTKSLLEQKHKLENDLKKLEEQVYALESSYLEGNFIYLFCNICFSAAIYLSCIYFLKK